MSQAQKLDSEALAKIIVGLGNPGRKYARTRHNIGFMAVEALAREAYGKWTPFMLSRVCRADISGLPVLLVEPLTYMNNSGKAVHALLSSLHRKARDLLLMLDDFNLPFGRIRIRERGSDGGHHGLESIQNLLKTDEILRVRMGVGEERMPEDRIDFVLSEFPKDKEAGLEEMIIKSGNAVKSLLSNGVSKTMAIFNA